MTGDYPGVYLNYMMLVKVDGNKYIEFNVDQGCYSNWDGAEITELGITATGYNTDQIFAAYDQNNSIRNAYIDEYPALFE